MNLGYENPLVPLENGRDAAEAIPGAELMIIKGMGHTLPIEDLGHVLWRPSQHTREKHQISSLIKLPEKNYEMDLSENADRKPPRG